MAEQYQNIVTLIGVVFVIYRYLRQFRFKDSRDEKRFKQLKRDNSYVIASLVKRKYNSAIYDDDRHQKIAGDNSTVTYKYIVDGVEYKSKHTFEDDYPSSPKIYYVPQNPKKHYIEGSESYLRYKKGVGNCLGTVLIFIIYMLIMIHGVGRILGFTNGWRP